MALPSGTPMLSTPSAIALRGSAPVQAAPAGVSSPSVGSLALAATAAAVGIQAVGRRVAVAQYGRKPRGVEVRTDTRPPAYKTKAPPAFAPAEQVGAMMPLGYFDPLGMCPAGNEGKFRRFREAELKHGRVAMLASVGMVTQHYLRLPGFENVPSGTLAIEVEPANKAWWFIIALCGVLDFFVFKQDFNKEVGDFGDPAGFSKIFGYNKDIREKEINNGRMAMMSAIGILWAEGATNKDGVDQLIAAGLPIGGSVAAPAVEAAQVAQVAADAAQVVEAAAKVAS